MPLLTATQALKAEPKNLESAADMRATIAHYPQYIDDPSWDKPALVEPVVPDQL